MLQLEPEVLHILSNVLPLHHISSLHFIFESNMVKAHHPEHAQAYIKAPSNHILVCFPCIFLTNTHPVESTADLENFIINKVTCV